MKFLSENRNLTPYADSVFAVVRQAKADPEGFNATAGCLYDEEGKLFTFDSVRKCEEKLSAIDKASYSASPAGNNDYIDSVCDFILDGRVDNHHVAIASAGGTGAIYLGIRSCLEEGDTLIIPDIAWGNYRVMANEYDLNVSTYDVFDLDDMFAKIDAVKGKVFIIINSPCQNPLGQSYALPEWERIMEKLNSLDKEAVLLCDIAYIDYARGDNRDYFKLFNELSDNVLVLIAASCSKAFSYYGQRLGELIAINNDEEFLGVFLNLATRLARATYSNLNNGAMKAIADVLKNHYEEYEAELAKAREMLAKRVDLFNRQAEECGLNTYPYTDGFFVTIKMPDNKLRDGYHQRLLNEHIYTIKVNRGVRVALCSLPLKEVDGLAYRLKELI